jgi:hypothetical protein
MYELIINWRAATGTAPLYFSGTITPAISGLLVDDYSPIVVSYTGGTIIKTFAGPTTATYTFVIKVNVASGAGGFWNDIGGGCWIRDTGLAVTSQ